MLTVVEPVDELTGAASVCSAVTIVAFVATAETTVPVSSPVIAILRASAESTLLSAGTGNTDGLAAVVPVETDDPPTVSVVVAAVDRKV